MLWLRSLLFNTGMIATLLAGSVCVVLARPFLPFHRRFALAGWFTRGVLAWLRTTCALTHQVEGMDHIPGGPVVFFAKHQSAWETFFLQSYLPPFTWILKREAMWIPVVGWGIATLAPIAIDRAAGRDAVRQIVEQGRARLDEGIRVMIFPEGTRVAAGQTRRFGMGGAVLAEACGGPIVPIAHNSGLYWSRRGFKKFPGTIRVVVGEPINTRGMDPDAINTLAKAWIDATTARLEAETKT